jgi:hypothetical protein
MTSAAILEVGAALRTGSHCAVGSSAMISVCIIQSLYADRAGSREKRDEEAHCDPFERERQAHTPHAADAHGRAGTQAVQLTHSSAPAPPTRRRSPPRRRRHRRLRHYTNETHAHPRPVTRDRAGRPDQASPGYWRPRLVRTGGRAANAVHDRLDGQGLHGAGDAAAGRCQSCCGRCQRLQRGGKPLQCSTLYRPVFAVISRADMFRCHVNVVSSHALTKMRPFGT